jgi:hypothetical protein
MTRRSNSSKGGRLRNQGRVTVLAVVLSAAAIMGSANPSQAADTLLHTITASSCLELDIACATITQEWYWAGSAGSKYFAVYTTAEGRGAILPGSLVASMQVGPPHIPDHLSDTKACGWAATGSSCSVDLTSFGTIPVSGCVTEVIALSASGRALDDPLQGPLTATASAGRTLSICNDGTLTVL